MRKFIWTCQSTVQGTDFSDKHNVKTYLGVWLIFCLFLDILKSCLSRVRSISAFCQRGICESSSSTQMSTLISTYFTFFLAGVDIIPIQFRAFTLCNPVYTESSCQDLYWVWSKSNIFWSRYSREELKGDPLTTRPCKHLQTRQIFHLLTKVKIGQSWRQSDLALWTQTKRRLTKKSALSHFMAEGSKRCPAPLDRQTLQQCESHLGPMQ